MLEIDDCINLLAAVARQWLVDARRDAHELALLADWLGMAPATLAQRWATPAAPVIVRPGHCPECGQALRQAARGKQPRYCSQSCRASARSKKGSHQHEA